MRLLNRKIRKEKNTRTFRNYLANIVPRFNNKFQRKKFDSKEIKARHNSDLTANVQLPIFFNLINFQKNAVFSLKPPN